MGFRAAFKQLSFPVSIIVNNQRGLTINSLTSFSVNPNLIAFNIYKESPLLPFKNDFDIYCLQSHHVHVARHYSRQRHLLDMPEDTIQLRCTLVDKLSVRDHIMFIAHPHKIRNISGFKSLQHVNSEYQ